MSKIDRDVVRHLERLARIDLSPDEVEMITEQLGRIVGFVEKLQAAEVEGVEPTRAMSHEAEDHVREDVVTPSLDRAVVLSQAPDHTPDYFRVPRVIEKGEGE
ncbi:MAG: Asp-tRNA(Asn)/Glu-tRNA(Gln) amidotransferase subunit GatC [Candidatus Latescibacteria bacterium]|nr:Asp-tRNA(Asn)/Glu-tRNA(Gln) amidotransferase subunit GatC [Candidatus Latescibacterota bacterium]